MIDYHLQYLCMTLASKNVLGETAGYFCFKIYF